MPVIEKYGLGVLLVLCGVIVLVGLFAENPVAKAAEKIVYEQQVLANGEQGEAKLDEFGFPGFSDPPKSTRGGANSGLKPVLPDDKRRRSFPLRELPGPAMKRSPLERGSKKGPEKLRLHKMRSDENFSVLALKYYGNANLFERITAANPSLNPKLIMPGTMVNIPVLGAKTKPRGGGVSQKRRHKIVKGDNLSTLAQHLLGSAKFAQRIADANRIDLNSKLELGQVLVIPKKRIPKKR